MPLFDAYIMTDWSGGSRRRKNRQDAIWIAHGDIERVSPQTESPSSRTEAIELIRSLLHEWVTSKLRVLVCFDFAYGYPVDFATALRVSDRQIRFTLAAGLAVPERDSQGRHRNFAGPPT
jgi:hypothetical protein